MKSKYLITAIVVIVLLVLVGAHFVARNGGVGSNALSRRWAIIQLGNGELIEGWATDISYGGTFVHLTVNGIHFQTGSSNLILCDQKP